MTPPGAAAPHLVPPKEAGAPPIRLMIVDDSAIARAVLSRMISSQPGFTVAATAATAAEALETLRHSRVDIVLLDVEMPGMSGLEALPEIVRQGGGARVLVVSSQCEAGAEAAVKALAMGAADTLPKPGVGNFNGRFSAVLAERLRRIGRIEAAPAAPPGRAESPLILREAPAGRLGCLGLGASTGGLYAIGAFLRALPPRIGAPILVTQHLPDLFIPFFAGQVEAAAARPVRIAVDGMAPRPDEIILAPGDAHLALEQRGSRVKVRLERTPAAIGCMPSVDVMLASMGEIYGRSGVGVVLSGMGRDGLLGARRLAECGGILFAQDRKSSAVWGMPRAVAEAGLASAVEVPEALAGRIAARLEERP